MSKDFLRQVSALNKKLDKAIDAKDEDVQKALFIVANQTVGEIKKVVPVQTGNLRGSIHIVEPSPAPQVSIKAGAEYAADVEFGDKKHQEGKKGAFMQHGVSWFMANGEELIGKISKK